MVEESTECKCVNQISPDKVEYLEDKFISAHWHCLSKTSPKSSLFWVHFFEVSTRWVSSYGYISLRSQQGESSEFPLMGTFLWDFNKVMPVSSVLWVHFFEVSTRWVQWVPSWFHFFEVSTRWVQWVPSYGYISLRSQQGESSEFPLIGTFLWGLNKASPVSSVLWVHFFEISTRWVQCPLMGTFLWDHIYPMR